MRELVLTDCWQSDKKFLKLDVKKSGFVTNFKMEAEPVANWFPWGSLLKAGVTEAGPVIT